MQNAPVHSKKLGDGIFLVPSFVQTHIDVILKHTVEVFGLSIRLGMVDSGRRMLYTTILQELFELFWSELTSSSE